MLNARELSREMICRLQPFHGQVRKSIPGGQEAALLCQAEMGVVQGGCVSSAMNLEEGKSRQRVLSDGENSSEYSRKLAVQGAMRSSQRQEGPCHQHPSPLAVGAVFSKGLS